jgi:hypothetical protein
VTTNAVVASVGRSTSVRELGACKIADAMMADAQRMAWVIISFRVMEASRHVYDATAP